MRFLSYVALTVTAAAVGWVGCAPTETPEQLAARITRESAAAKQAIDAADANWARLTAAGHADSIAQFYQADAVLLPPNMPPVHGVDSIRAFFAVINTMSDAGSYSTLAIRATDVWANGPVAVEQGRWVFTWPRGLRRPPGVPPVDSGKYLVRWVNEGGRWLMMNDIWNSDTAPPGSPGGQ